MAVNPAGEVIRDQMDPSVTDMSMAAWPSITPTRPLSACCRAACTSGGFSSARNSSASSTIISGPPTNSAAVNCQPSSTARMMPSSTTRLVEANWNAIALVKSAPLRNTERAIATAAYEQEEEAAPSPQAIVRERGESSGSSRPISALETTAWTAPEIAKPRISAHRISHAMAAARLSAWPTASTTITCVLRPVGALSLAVPVHALLHTIVGRRGEGIDRRSPTFRRRIAGVLERPWRGAVVRRRGMSVLAAVGLLVSMQGPDGQVRLGQVRHPDGRAEVLSATLPVLSDGSYLVSWRIVSADDGHVEAGS